MLSYDYADGYYQHHWLNYECSTTAYAICEYPAAGDTPKK